MMKIEEIIRAECEDDSDMKVVGVAELGDGITLTVNDKLILDNVGSSMVESLIRLLETLIEYAGT